FVGKFGDWVKLKNSWNKRLKRDGLTYFRATEYYSLRGEFAKYRDPINDGSMRKGVGQVLEPYTSSVLLR
ncbi:MAG TPA: hypothetical protein VG272_06295, partial [Candidatus Acidoferrales bacterium]|nr:hypothetical protein [Candidatus Acidoferrales bacterium]